MSAYRAAPSEAVHSHRDVSLLGHHPLILSFPSRARVDDIVFIFGLFGFLKNIYLFLFIYLVMPAFSVVACGI